MRKTPETTDKRQPGASKKLTEEATNETLQLLAFDNSPQANIISTVSSGKIIVANSAACKLLNYSKKELLTKSRADIFDINESNFKEMLKQRTAEGQSTALVTVIKKSGKTLSCEIISGVFMDEDGIEKTITTISDKSQSILQQKTIDSQKEKIVADNIVLAKSKQKEIDIKKEKVVADNIVLAKTKQKEIDIKKEKVVAENIVLAKSKQKEIDIKKEKVVAENIVLAKSEQKEIDIKKEKIVAENIVLAKTKQNEIDIKKEKVVADNIVLAKSEQKQIDIKKEKIVAENIDLAKSKQREIDVKKEKLVADNIALAKTQQKKIDIQKEKIVADDIVLALEKSDTRLTENNEWIKHIARTSYDVMWDWDIVTGRVYIGDSLAEVFGYKLKDNMIDFTALNEDLLAGEKNVVEDKLTRVLASGKNSWNDSYKLKRYDGSVASVISRGSIVRDESGRAIRMIGATQDVSKLEELENVLEEQKEKFFLASKLSFDVIWEWNILTNELNMGEGFEELFGYTLADKKGNKEDWGNHLHPDDKEAVEEGLHAALASSVTHWEHAYRFTRADGSIARVFDRASIIRDDDGKACRMIGAMQDLSRLKELEEKLDIEIAAKGKLLTGYSESFKLIFNSSSDILYDVDLKTDKVVVSDAYEKEFGYKITSEMTSAEAWHNHIHPDDKKAVLKDYSRVLASDETEWKYSYRFLRADNSVANIISNRIILRDASGKAYRILGSMHDVSKQKRLEERLEQEIRLKEKQIAVATKEAKETERSDLGKELHDNVNQLLAVSKLYLDLAKRGGENSEMYLSRSSEYTLTAIEEIRKLTKVLTADDIKNIGLREAIINIIRDTMEVNPVKIAFVLENFKESEVNDKFRHNVFRIIQEQLNNILKHANATEVAVSLLQNNESIMLTISDNGVGFDTSKKRKGIGIDNIKSRALSFSGNADFVSQPGQGCVLTVTFPVTDRLLNKELIPTTLV